MADLDVGKVRRILRDALDVWSRGSRLTFQEVYSKDADIQVLFARRHHGDGYDFDGPGSVLAHAFYPGTGRGGDAHFDEEEKWTLSATENDGTNLMGVAVHEFGHSIGLGHSSVESALMFPWYHGYQKFKELPEDDRLAIQQIYGSRGKIWGDITTTSTTTTTARSYYPERDPQWEERRRQQEWDERKRQQAEWEKKEQERWQRTQREREKQEQERKAKEREIERRKNGVRPNYQPSTTVSTPKKTWKPYHNHNHNHHSKFNKNTSNPKEKKPETCNTSYDAISIIRGELFIFKDRYLWRIGKDGLLPGYPHEIDKLWKGLPKNFTHIDTVYENKYGKIIFFIGKMYYVFDASTLVDGYPKALTTLGLPASLDKIDAALVWGHNNRTYFYSGTMYWRFDEDIDHVELDYPRDMSIWRGIGYNIDSAFQYKDGKTYFFKDKSYWQFDDSTMRVARWKSELSAQRWMKCPRVTATYSNEVYDDEDDEERREPLTASAIIIMNSAITLPLFTIIVLCINVNF